MNRARQLRRRHHADVSLAEPPVAVARDEIVDPVAQRPRDDDERVRERPGKVSPRAMRSAAADRVHTRPFSTSTTLSGDRAEAIDPSRAGAAPLGTEGPRTGIARRDRGR